MAANIQDHDDFAVHGLDSEQTVSIISSLKRNLRKIAPKPIDWITPRIIFRHSTVDSLCELTHASGPSELTTAALIRPTGYLGSYLTATFLRYKNIGHIIRLNRASDAAKRQEAALLKLDQNLQPVFGKLTYITINFDQPSLGLTSDAYQKLATDVDVLIFNGWQFNFALPLRAFHSFLSATRANGLTKHGSPPLREPRKHWDVFQAR
ncbi:hypothetical protein CIB48_g9997 [Xylaria polymorpha]|nr:hypothetical protein CIB48_g9997 [Xylaria polymorpha]